MKTLLCILFSLAIVKNSTAQKINVPDSLPFTLEYVDSISFFNAKQLQPKLIKDTSDFKKVGGTLSIFKNKKIIYSIVDSVEQNQSDSVFDNCQYRPIGYYNNNGQKWYVINAGYYEWENRIIIPPPYSNDYLIYVSDSFIISPKYDKMFDYSFSGLYYFRSEISLTEITSKKIKRVNTYSFKCYKDDTITENEDCKVCNCYEWESAKWHDYKTIFIHGSEYYSKKSVFLKMVLK